MPYFFSSNISIFHKNSVNGILYSTSAAILFPIYKNEGKWAFQLTPNMRIVTILIRWQPRMLDQSTSLRLCQICQSSSWNPELKDDQCSKIIRLVHIRIKHIRWYHVSKTYKLNLHRKNFKNRKQGNERTGHTQHNYCCFQCGSNSSLQTQMGHRRLGFSGQEGTDCLVCNPYMTFN